MFAAHPAGFPDPKEVYPAMPDETSRGRCSWMCAQRSRDGLALSLKAIQGPGQLLPKRRRHQMADFCGGESSRPLGYFRAQYPSLSPHPLRRSE